MLKTEYIIRLIKIMDLDPYCLVEAVENNEPIYLKNCSVLYSNIKFIHNGWSNTEEFIKPDLEETQRTIDFCTFTERYFGWIDFDKPSPFKRKWIGIIHDPFTNYIHDQPKKKKLDPDRPAFIESLSLCCKLYVLTRNEAIKWENALEEIGFGHVPVGVIYHPEVKPNPENMFSWDKFWANTNPRIYQAGYWLRKTYAIYKLSCWELKLKFPILKKYNKPFQKYIIPWDGRTHGLLWFNCKKDNIELTENDKKSVIKIPPMEQNEFEKLFADSIFYLDVYDATVCNIVLQCKAHKTPIFVKWNDNLAEYLGDDYPYWIKDDM